MMTETEWKSRGFPNCWESFPSGVHCSSYLLSFLLFPPCNVLRHIDMSEAGCI